MTNCQIEEEFVNKKQSQNFKITKQTFEELILNEKFNNAFVNLPKLKSAITSSLQGRTVMEDQYGFTIAEQPAKVIEMENKTSYTFLITRENQPDGYFENLIIEVNSTNHTKAIVVKYIPTAQLNLTLENKVNFVGNIDITPITYNSNSTADYMQLICVDVIGSLCNGVPYDCGGSICGFGTYQVCSWGNGGSSSGSGSGTGSGTGGSNSGGTGGDSTSSSSDPVVDILHNTSGTSNSSGSSGSTPTLIVKPDDEISSQITPCKGLIKMSNSITNKNALVELVSRTDEEKEYGYAFKKSSSNITYQAPTAIPNDPNNPNFLNVKDYIGGDYIGILHTHPNPIYGYYPMFSDHDLKCLFTLARKHVVPVGQVKDYSEYVIAMTTNDGTFAIKIKDITKFFSTINDITKFKKIKKLLLKKYQKRDSNDNINGFKKDLLNLFEEFDMGVGLFQANSDFTLWSEVNLDPSNPNNIPLLTPCN
jgi:hypothetical protein